MTILFQSPWGGEFRSMHARLGCIISLLLCDLVSWFVFLFEQAALAPPKLRIAKIFFRFHVSKKVLKNIIYVITYRMSFIIDSVNFLIQLQINLIYFTAERF